MQVGDVGAAVATLRVLCTQHTVQPDTLRVVAKDTFQRHAAMLFMLWCLHLHLHLWHCAVLCLHSAFTVLERVCVCAMQC